MQTLTIGQVARRAGVGIETVRFYEREGLLQKPRRKSSGYREYTEEVIAVLQFIQRAKYLGFPLKEIKELLEIQFDATTAPAVIRNLAQAKIADLQSRVDCRCV